MLTTNASLAHIYDSPSGAVRFLIFQTEEVLAFTEGQFVMVEMEIHGKIMKKPYSIATTNKQMMDEKHLGIIVKKTSDRGMSDHMTQTMNIGDHVTIKGPVGHYTDSKKHRNYLFISVGSGLSPNVGLFQHLVYESHAYDTIINIFGERYHTHIIPEVQDLFMSHGQEHIHNFFHLSQDEFPPEGYSSGYVQDSLTQAISVLGVHTSCFLCGKPEMVDDVRAKLEDLGIAKEDITFEKY